MTWDTVTRKATVEVLWQPDKAFTGQLLLVRNDVNKVNLLFKELDETDTEYEFLLFKIYQGEYRLLTAGYTYVDGVRYLTGNLADHWADCTSDESKQLIQAEPLRHTPYFRR